jgi:carboxyl-terminal processing protease
MSIPKKYLNSKVIWISASIVLALGLFVLGLYIGFAHRSYVSRVTGISNSEAPAGISADFEPFWKVWNIIDQKYPDANGVSAQDRVYGAIKGLVGSIGDPYSVYFPPQDSKDFKDVINGSFEGIGMEVGIKDKILTVVAPLKGTPAEAAGIKAGDKLIKIGNVTTSDMSVDKAVELIRGPKGTTVKLTIYHDGATAPVEISVTRDTINIPTLDEILRPDGVYVITLYNFDAASDNLMRNALKNFAASGSKSLVLDLRGNPGGYLDSAVDMASFFLPEGDTVVTEDFGSNGTQQIYRSKGFSLLDLKNIKVAILVDKGSASASEILAGALNQHNVAPLIGETTYGKGSVQEVVDITKDTTLKITVAKWLTPDGTWISKKGLTPTIPVTLTAANTANHADPVLDRALQYFKTGK